MEERKTGELLHELWKTSGMSLEDMRDKLGYATISGVSERLRNYQRYMRIDVYIKMLNALGCDLIVRTEREGKLDNGKSVKYTEEWKLVLNDDDDGMPDKKPSKKVK